MPTRNPTAARQPLMRDRTATVSRESTASPAVTIASVRASARLRGCEGLPSGGVKKPRAHPPDSRDRRERSPARLRAQMHGHGVYRGRVAPTQRMEPEREIDVCAVDEKHSSRPPASLPRGAAIRVGPATVRARSGRDAPRSVERLDLPAGRTRRA